MKTYKIIDKSTQIHEYNIDVEDADEGTKYTLKASKGKQWSEHIKDTPFVTIVDDGNGIQIIVGDFFMKIGKTKRINIFTDYSFEEYLRVLLNFKNNIEFKPQHYDVHSEPVFNI